MSTRTDWDYADMVNPHVRAEQEAESRGYRSGIRDTIFVGALIIIVVVGLLYAR